MYWLGTEEAKRALRYAPSKWRTAIFKAEVARLREVERPSPHQRTY
jgi:hypothetical protein